MSAVFTAGPWRYEHRPRGHPSFSILVARQAVIVAKAWVVEDARLIAAAPTMYERLALLVQVLSALPVLQKNDELWGAYTGAVAVLLQARGEAA